MSGDTLSSAGIQGIEDIYSVQISHPRNVQKTPEYHGAKTGKHCPTVPNMFMMVNIIIDENSQNDF